MTQDTAGRVLLAAAMGVVAAASLLLTATAQARGRADVVEVRLANPPGCGEWIGGEAATAFSP